MANNKFKLGDLVVLPSSPRIELTVVDISGDQVTVSWFVAGELRSATFHADALRPT